MALLLLHPCSCSTPPSHPFHLPFKKSTSNLLLFTVPTLRRRFVPNRLPPSLNASLAVDSPKLLLEVKDLSAVIAESKQPILKGVNLVIYEGEVNAVMGKNGSGKSTFATEFTRGSVVFKGKNVLGMDPEVRSLTGLFMSFQSPVEIPGVSNIDFLNMAYNARKRTLGLPELGPIEFYGYISPRLNLVNMKVDFLNRNVNKGFSGGERRHLALLDEIDSGLDVDALQDVAKAVNGLLSLNNSVLMITHYHRLLEFIKPTYVHIMEDGRIMETGDESMAKRIEKEGYKAISA